MWNICQTRLSKHMSEEVSIEISEKSQIGLTKHMSKKFRISEEIPEKMPKKMAAMMSANDVAARVGPATFTATAPKASIVTCQEWVLNWNVLPKCQDQERLWTSLSRQKILTESFTIKWQLNVDQKKNASKYLTIMSAYIFSHKICVKFSLLDFFFSTSIAKDFFVLSKICIF